MRTNLNVNENALSKRLAGRMVGPVPRLAFERDPPHLRIVENPRPRRRTTQGRGVARGPLGQPDHPGARGGRHPRAAAGQRARLDLTRGGAGGRAGAAGGAGRDDVVRRRHGRGRWPAKAASGRVCARRSCALSDGSLEWPAAAADALGLAGGCSSPGSARARWCPRAAVRGPRCSCARSAVARSSRAPTPPSS